MKKITLKNYPSGVCPVVYLNQFDAGRQFQLAIVDEAGADFALTGYTVKINGRKADDHVFEYTESDKWKEDGGYIITKSTNIVTISTTEQMTAAAGDCLAQLVLIKTADGSIAGTLNFIMHIQEQPYANGDPSGSDFPEIIAMATEQMERAETAANTAVTKAGEASTSAQTATTKAGEASTSAQTATNKASDAIAAADRAQSYSIHPPYVGANGNWWEWDYTLNPPAYKDSGIDAGVTMQIGTVQAVPFADGAEVTNTGTSSDAILNFKIPSGKSAYELAVEGGYQGTEAQFEADLMDFKTYAQTASTKAGEASTSASNAAGSATAAAGSAADSEAYAVGKRNGTDVPSTDPAYHNNALYYANEAHQSESNAAASEQAASGYASNAQGFASDAQGYASDAGGYAGAAAQSASDADLCATAAGNSSGEASVYREDARGFAQSAQTSAGNAATSETNAANSATAAAASAAATADVSTGSTGKTVKVAINPTAAQIAAYSNGAIWIETT